MSFNIDGVNHCEYAHRIVRETGCPFCGSRPGQRCITQPTKVNPLGRALQPHASHRARLEAHAVNARL